MWDYFIQMIRNDEKETLFKDCANRCLQSFNTIYDFEKMGGASFWQLDHRYYENSMAILYERYCYAMSMIVDQFCDKYEALYRRKETYEDGITFLVVMNKCADIIFEKQTNGLSFRDGTIFYYEEDYTADDYDEFWEEHWEEKEQILTVRKMFTNNERKWEFGFHSKDDDYEDDLQMYNKDFLHIQKVIGLTSEVDVENFLNKSKREYLPIIIEAFSQKYSTDMFKTSKKWWQFWK